MEQAFIIKNLTKSVMGLKILDDLTVNIGRGISTGLIGPNGSGKSTLMNVLTGLLTPNHGEITINGKTYNKIEHSDMDDIKIARTFQDGRVIDLLSVEDNVLLSVADKRRWASLLGNSKNKYQDKLESVLKNVNLTEAKYKVADELSYAQRKLLELARVLIQEADIYFFDEPFTGLSPAMVEHVVDIMLDLKKQGKTLVVIEHNMGLIQRLCERVIVLNHGALLAEGTPNAIKKNKVVQEAYLGK